MNMDGWDVVLFAVAAYFAVMILVRLMRKRRDDLVADMRQQVGIEQKRIEAEAERKQQEGEAKLTVHE